MTTPLWVSTHLALAIHRAQILEHGGDDGLRDALLLESAINRPKNIVAYEGESADISRLAASYLFGIVRNHPFVDGNKRTGLVVAGVFLKLNGHRIVAPLPDLYSMAMAAANGEIDESEIADWIRRHLQKF